MNSSYVCGFWMVLCGVSLPALAGNVKFIINVDGTVASSAVSGRLVIGLVRDDIASLKQTDPNDAPIWDEPQPMLAATITDLTPGTPVYPTTFDAVNTTGTAALEGTYRVAARLITNRQTSNWRNDAGNLYTAPINVTFTKDGDQTVELTLSQKTPGRTWPAEEAAALGAQLVEIRSTLLSDFHHRDVMLRASVVPPRKMAEGAKYAAVYQVPGFGGRHFDGLQEAKRRKEPLEGAAAKLADQTFWITLDPESPNGHTLFADSANNGPCGKALVEELIPAIEAKFPQLATKPEARMLRGHSSGGWSTLWLTITYPQTFGACWSSSPDPVDFRRFQLIDIYGQRSAYLLAENDLAFSNPLKQSMQAPVVLGDRFLSRVEFGGRPRVLALGSFRNKGKCVMTVEQETRGEDVLGPDNTSGQQWDSWWAVFCPRNARGNPVALIDPATGNIDSSVADVMRPYDIAEQLRNSPGKLGQIFRSRVRLVVGTADNFYLNEAVSLLQTELDRRVPPLAPDKQVGYIEFVQGADHGTVFQSPRIKGIPAEMVAHLERSGLAIAAEPAPAPPK
ncbi:MAG: alpha/beta hydrolase-fold protein [Planctomycetota bacterium]|nr:alpha/beta hydrolase-fold protein [Planctomycetota bacterium]